MLQTRGSRAHSIIIKAIGCLNTDNAIYTVRNSAPTKLAGNSYKASLKVRLGFRSALFNLEQRGRYVKRRAFIRKGRRTVM